MKAKLVYIFIWSGILKQTITLREMIERLIMSDIIYSRHKASPSGFICQGGYYSCQKFKLYLLMKICFSCI